MKRVPTPPLITEPVRLMAGEVEFEPTDDSSSPPVFKTGAITQTLPLSRNVSYEDTTTPTETHINLYTAPRPS